MPVLLLRVEEAAIQLGISRTVAFRLVREGDLASVKIGRSRRIPRLAIDAYVDALLATQPAASADGSLGGAA
jgi:excisionase family DNA binding protein